MELYYKNLISEDASLEKLVDDLMLVVQGADELAHTAGTELTLADKEEITSGLQRIKSGYQRLQKRALVGARAADRLLRDYPYSSAGFAFALGMLAAWGLNRKHRD
jgi:ElaB/YqjD/DUF883 family membrane-anchored ribosome-binding protein